MHELEVLLSRLKMEHLSYHVESLLEQAAKPAPFRGGISALIFLRRSSS